MGELTERDIERVWARAAAFADEYAVELWRRALCDVSAARQQARAEVAEVIAKYRGTVAGDS